MLEKIKSPNDVKHLTLTEMTQLASEIREKIINVTAKNGGHIAPSLGVVELTIALLKVFNPLINSIVWDVGHQSYAYKILTGRNEQFDTLRQFNGISGFNKITESKYDAFGVGHTSTSISAALGITTAKELNNHSKKTIAIIGDGAMTAGLAFEGLNNAGGLKKDLIVILNDNNMSISKSVGGLQKYFADILASKPYNKFRDEIWKLIQSLPKNIRNKIIFGAHKLEEALKNILVPNIFFEDLGFRYIGPIDGHDIENMVKIFRGVKHNIIGPVLIHIITQKGKGYEFAENDAVKFHGISPFDNETGKIKTANANRSYSQVFGDTLVDIGKNDKKVVAITAAMAEGTGLCRFAKEFPDRFFDVGIAEQHAVTFAAGLAVQGIKPYVAIYSTFLQRAYDQIIHDVALQNLPVRFCIDRAGIVGEDGPTHHGVFDLSYLRCIPNIVIIAPKCEKEFVMMLKFMHQYNKGPIAIRYPRGETPIYNNLSLTPIELGKSEVIEQGEKIAIITIGTAYEIGYELRNKLNEDGFNPYLVNARFVKPIDDQMLNTLIKNGVNYIITIEDNVIAGGFGSAVLEKVNMLTNKVKVRILGIGDTFVTHGNTNTLFEFIGLTAEKIYNEIRPDIKKRRRRA
ncbi:MAG: 1-deoxy-D-xylulose-5-phosphate synthase [Candidatus Cloacimonadota bacterium]|nr:MAG: 1-deoxy-D-xylulose-5-phosphate synthase [Candidatus Cloacimonadota bacterium]